jgi:hypothetical protein
MNAPELTMTDGNPGQAVVDGVEHILALAETWLAWDGRPRRAADSVRAYTPVKAIRRHADHLIDHLAHIESLLSGVPSIEDRWHASYVTLASDLQPFTEADLNEAQQRLRRLAQLYVLRLEAAGPEAWDVRHEPDGTVREIVTHVAGTYYADQIGDLR